MSSENKPHPPYMGNGPFVYASYATEDMTAVFPEIRRFQNLGYNVFYDDENLNEDALRQSKALVIFFTPNSAKSERIADEIDLCIEMDKYILPIYLVETELDLGLDFKLTGTNSISKYKMELSDYISKFKQSFKNFGIKSNKAIDSKLIVDSGRQPFPAFRGEGSYMFVSYAHKDSDIVFSEIKRFQDMGYNVWYDEGIGAGNEWLKDVLEHLVGCDLFVVFVTNNSVKSKNVQKEIKFAISKEKNIVPIYLEDFDEIEMDLQLEYELSVIQGIIKTTLDEEEYVFKFSEAFHHFGFNPRDEFDDDIFKRIELKDPWDVLMDNSLKYEVLYNDFDCKNISNYVDDFFEGLTLYEDFYNGHVYKEILKSSIELFLSYKCTSVALEVYRTFFDIYEILTDSSFANKNELLELIDVIASYCRDNCGSELERDLFVNSVNTFILGLAIYAQNDNYQNCFKKHVTDSDYRKYYKVNDEFSDEEFLYRWGITSLLHNIYHPLEKTGKKQRHNLYQKFDSILGKDRVIEDFNDLNVIYKGDPNFAKGYGKTYPDARFLDMFKSTDLLSHKLSRDFSCLNVNQVKNGLKDLMDLIESSGLEEHGLLAAFLILNHYSYEIQDSLMDSSIFFDPILDCASAIFLHNYYSYFLMHEPFNLTQLGVEQNPLAYLLILCDNILEFETNMPVENNKINTLTDIEIDNEKLQATYIIQKFPYGFGFSNELYLEDILNIGEVFNDGISISNDWSNLGSHDFSIHSIELTNYSMKLVEMMAMKMHEQTVADYELPSYNELDAESKLNLIRQAKSVSCLLNSIGCEIAEISDERPSINEFSDNDVVQMAIFEHNDWCRDKIGKGWRYGENIDRQYLTHNALVSWFDLSDNLKQEDIITVKNIPQLVDSLGFKIVPSKLRILTSKIFALESEGENFESLPGNLKKIYYKKTGIIFEALSKLDYVIVDNRKPGEAVVEFEDDEIIYLAQETHDEWSDFYNSFVWKFEGDEDFLKDGTKLVVWEKLSFKYARMQIDVLKHFPEFCSEIGLKIIYNVYKI